MQTGEIFQERYRIQNEVGRGSFGIVYAADDLKTGQTVAIKILLPWTRGNESLRHRLKREAKLTRMLKSPHAIRIYDLEETADGEFYIVMELLEGQDLSQLLARETRLRPERAREIGRQVLDALAEAHALGVIHRDLKPHNIFVTTAANGADRIKVLDFGIAKVAGNEDGTGLTETTRLTAPGGVLGTPVYMSPEQCRGEALTPASDFYSLGVVLYETVVGQPPFNDSNPVQVLVMHNNETPPPLPVAIGRTPLGQAIMRTLEKDPHARFRTAAEFMSGLGYESLPPAPVSPANVPQPAAAPQAAVLPTAVSPPAMRQSFNPEPTATVSTRESDRRRRSGGLKNLFARYWIVLLILLPPCRAGPQFLVQLESL